MLSQCLKTALTVQVIFKPSAFSRKSGLSSWDQLCNLDHKSHGHWSCIRTASTRTPKSPFRHLRFTCWLESILIIERSASNGHIKSKQCRNEFPVKTDFGACSAMLTTKYRTFYCKLTTQSSCYPTASFVLMPNRIHIQSGDYHASQLWLQILLLCESLYDSIV